ncbi:MAG TPA: dienelactone hydrolase family protein [Gemmatimonadaceae bacterium]|nr:dienelactone hydrolase family protein [Gemmatimonadaceae bacterium]
MRDAVALLTAVSLAACSGNQAEADEHAGHDTGTAAASATASTDSTIAPSAANARQRLEASPRHGEWAMIPAGSGDSVRAWVVYPERSDKAPVVLVVHEIFGLSTWIRSVADQLAADGFIAIAPDLLTGKYSVSSPNDTLSADSARALIRTLDDADVQRRLSAAARYGMALPSAQQHYGIVGFCWGGSTSFAHAVAGTPELGAAVVYYGTPPEDLAKVHAPVLGLYGQNDNRVTSTVPAADSAMKSLDKTYEHFIFDGAGHGFLRAQDGQNGANGAAAAQAWPKTVAWFDKYLR